MSTFTDLQPDEVPQMAALMTDGFNMPEEKTSLWIQRSGIPNWRALKEKDKIVGGLMRIPMGQWFGGQPVSMTGLAGVAISTTGRGKSTGQTLIRKTLEEMRQDGTALSALYGSVTSFYRRCGYERAGSRFLAEVPLKDLSARGGPLEVRPISEDMHPTIEAFQAEQVQHHGALVRGPYLWHRVRGPRGMTAQGFAFYNEDRLEGYTYMVKDLVSFRDNSLEATDVVLTTPQAMQTFFGLLAAHRAFFQSARWPSAPCSPLLLAMPEPWQYTLRLEEHWLLRIVSLDKALTQRGYPAHLSTRLHLEVEDPWFAQNSGRFTLTVEQGRPTLKVGGEGHLCLDIGALAALYTGFATAQDLAVSGRARGNPESLHIANAIFGGQTPQLPDFF